MKDELATSPTLWYRARSELPEWHQPQSIQHWKEKASGSPRAKRNATAYGEPLECFFSLFDHLRVVMCSQYPSHASIKAVGIRCPASWADVEVRGRVFGEHVEEVVGQQQKGNEDM